MERIKFLIDLLNTCRDSYYNKNNSLISDKEYDDLYDELKNLEDKTGILYANSPTQTVGYCAVSDLKKVKHNHPLLSLDKTTDFDKFVKYFADKKFVIMQKLDGLTISLHYVDGRLVSGETRGNGEIGEDITHNVKVIKNIPIEIPFKGELVIDGEAIIDKKSFDEINDKTKEFNRKLEYSYERNNTPGECRTGYKVVYKNQRNLASGTIRQLGNKICAERNIKFFAWNLEYVHDDSDEYKYDVLEYPNFTDKGEYKFFVCSDGLKTHTARLCFLQKLGFETCDFILTKNVNDDTLKEYADLIRSDSEKKGIPIDGLVGRFNDISYGESLGKTGHHLRHSLAFKFYQERNETTFRKIEWSISRNNLINPVAIFDPVEIDGTTVSRATLNNISQIKRLALGYDDSILVIKANQIIPQITDNLTRSGTVEIPDHCPICGSPTYIKQDGSAEFLYCSNEHCLGATIDRLVNFCGRDGMNIRGLSIERITALYNDGYINESFYSIYDIKNHKDAISDKAGFGDSSVNKLLEAIEESRSRPLANVLVAIGIPSIGKSTAKLIAKKCGNSLDTFLCLTHDKYDWSKLPDIGKSTSDKINEYINSNYDKFKTLFSILISNEEELNSSNVLDGKTFCITGKLIQYKNRDALVKDIERFGGKIVSGVSSKTNYLITNNKEEQTSKTKNAKKFGTKIISEEDFVGMIKGE